MSNLVINIRFGCYHLQLEKRSIKPKISYNAAHKGNPKRFEIYQFFGYFN
jgi:hypothetical protein